jgi:hypothetical protein
MHMFGEKVYFGKDLILERRPNSGVHAIDGNKATCKKRRKERCNKKSNMARRQASLTMIRLGFLIKTVMAISL